MKKTLLTVALLFTTATVTAAPKPEQVGFMAEMSGACANNFRGWHGKADDFQQMHELMMRTIKRMSYSDRVRAANKGQETQDIIRKTTKSGMTKFCREQAAKYF